MKRWIGAAVTLAAIVWSATAANPRVSREAMAVLEKKFDQGVESFSIDDPFYLLGATRGVYLDDYGAVFTAELNLVAAAVVTPFRPSFTKEQVERLRQKKIRRLIPLKELMRNMMVDSATALKNVPPDERIVMGVTLFYYSWEDTRELPAQILMQARRGSLLDFEAGRIDGAGLDSVIRVQEF
jgi:hypothetical protein